MILFPAIDILGTKAVRLYKGDYNKVTVYSDRPWEFAEDFVKKEVHWYLMMADSYYSKPQREEYFMDSGYYKYNEAYHLLKFSNEKQILEKAYNEYLDLIIK